MLDDRPRCSRVRARTRVRRLIAFGVAAVVLRHRATAGPCAPGHAAPSARRGAGASARAARRWAARRSRGLPAGRSDSFRRATRTSSSAPWAAERRRSSSTVRRCRLSLTGASLRTCRCRPRARREYAIVASRGADTARAVHPIKLLPPRLVLADTGRLVVDSASVSPRGVRIARVGRAHSRERARAAQRESSPLRLADGTERRLVNAARALDSLRVPVGRERGRSVRLGDRRPGVAARARRGVRRRRGTRHACGFRSGTCPSTIRRRARWVRLTGGADVPDTDRVVILRPVPNGTYKWLLLAGHDAGGHGSYRRHGSRAPRFRRSRRGCAASDVTELPAGTRGSSANRGQRARRRVARLGGCRHPDW